MLTRRTAIVRDFTVFLIFSKILAIRQSKGYEEEEIVVPFFAMVGYKETDGGTGPCSIE